MTRLDLELARLFRMPDGSLAADGRSRTLVLGLAAPVDWPALGGLWRAVQAELGWPAPALAVDGAGAMQLWFALAEPVPLAQGQAILAGLVQRFLADVPATRLRRWPAADDSAAPELPPRPTGADRWSAFVSPDLAPLFADTPWLDMAPGEEGQAHLVSQCQPVAAPALGDAMVRLASAPAAAPQHAPPPMPRAAAPGEDHARAAACRFLLGVMHDEAAPLALRVEAAKALLQAGHPA